MLKGINLQELAAKIQAQSTAKKDFIVDTSKTTMQVIDSKPVLELPESDGTFPLQPIAHDQIAARTQIPARYYDRMRAEAPDLLATNVNAWFRKNPEQRMVRTLDGNARAFLSNRYQRHDHGPVAEVVLNELFNLPGVQVPSCEVTDRRLYIHFYLPTIGGEVKKGDIVHAGGVVSNSEVGLGSLSVAGLIWRLWCLNGAKTGEAFRKQHVGRRVEDNSELWADDTLKSDDKTVLLKVRDMVRAVVDETRFRATLGRMQDLTKIEAKHPVKAIELLSQDFAFGDGMKTSILDALVKGGDVSAWGIVNAVTSQAHAAASYDDAVGLEDIGGQLINLPGDQWSRLLEAA